MVRVRVRVKIRVRVLSYLTLTLTLTLTLARAAGGYVGARRDALRDAARQAGLPRQHDGAG